MSPYFGNLAEWLCKARPTTQSGGHSPPYIMLVWYEIGIIRQGLLKTGIRLSETKLPDNL
jgi:hypothetical protein